MKSDTLLELKHPTELLAGEDRPLLRRRPFTVGLGQLAERLTRLRIHRAGADKVFFVELRAAFKNERVQGASKLVGGSIDRLDLSGHLLLVKLRTASEIPQQVAGKKLPPPGSVVIFISGNADDKRVFLHCRFPLSGNIIVSTDTFTAFATLVFGDLLKEVDNSTALKRTTPKC